MGYINVLRYIVYSCAE
nr:truncated ORF10 protein [Severe acute respiratory syndrome coronavirus 2]